MGRILSYILIYSYLFWFWMIIALVLTVLMESFLCPNFRIIGLPLYVLFGGTSRIMCGEGPAFSDFLVNITVVSIFLIILYSFFLIFLNKIFKIPILEGEYKLDPITKLISKRLLNLFSKLCSRNK